MKTQEIVLTMKTVPQMFPVKPEWAGPWRYSPPAGSEKGMWVRIDATGAHYYLLADGSLRIDTGWR